MLYNFWNDPMKDNWAIIFQKGSFFHSKCFLEKKTYKYLCHINICKFTLQSSLSLSRISAAYITMKTSRNSHCSGHVENVTKYWDLQYCNSSVSVRKIPVKSVYYNTFLSHDGDTFIKPIRKEPKNLHWMGNSLFKCGINISCRLSKCCIIFETIQWKTTEQ